MGYKGIILGMMNKPVSQPGQVVFLNKGTYMYI
jgi:hypothetical protein